MRDGSIRLRPLAAAFLLVLVGLTAGLAGPAAAQDNPLSPTTLRLDVPPPDQPLRPDRPPVALKAKAFYSYVGTEQSEPEDTPMHLSVVSAPPWLRIAFAPDLVVLDPTSVQFQPSVTKEKEFLILLSVTPDAPAYAPGRVRIRADALENGDLAAASAELEFPVIAEFVSLLETSAAEGADRIARPQESVRFPLTVKNLGNADVKVTFTVVDAPEGLTIVPPMPVALPSNVTSPGNSSTTVNVLVQAPYRNGFLDEVYRATLELSAAYAYDAQLKGDRTPVTLTTTVIGFYLPGPGPLAAFGAVGLAALLARSAPRRRG